MIRKKSAILSSLIVFIFSVCFSFSVCATELEDERAQLHERNNEISRSIEESQLKIEDQKRRKSEIDSYIERLQQDIDSLEYEISKLNYQIDKKKKNIELTEESMKKNQKILKQAVTAVFKRGGEVSFLGILLKSKSLSDLSSKYQLLKSVNKRQGKVLEALNEAANKIKADKKDIEKNRESVLSKKNKLSDDRSNLYILVEESEQIINSLSELQKEEKRQLDLNSEAIKRLDAEIEEYYRSRGEEAPVYSGNYIWPTPGFHTITSPYDEQRGSRYHKALDIGGYNMYGTDVIAAQSGVVIDTYSCCTHYSAFCSCGGGYGNYVVIDHGAGKSTLYAHLSRVNVAEGQRVRRGEVIGKIGSTGHSTGPHLHFETRRYIDGSLERYNPFNEY